MKRSLIAVGALLFLAMNGFGAEKKSRVCYTSGYGHGALQVLVEPDVISQLSSDEQHRLETELSRTITTSKFELIEHLGSAGKDAAFVTFTTSVNERKAKSDKEAKRVITILNRYLPNYFFMKSKYSCATDAVKIQQ